MLRVAKKNMTRAGGPLAGARMRVVGFMDVHNERHAMKLAKRYGITPAAADADNVALWASLFEDGRVRLPVVDAYDDPDDDGNVTVSNFVLVPDVVISVDCYGNVEHKVLTLFVVNGPWGNVHKMQGVQARMVRSGAAGWDSSAARARVLA